MRAWAWASFWVLGLIWGSSFMLIRIGVGEFSTVEVVFIRTAIAAVGLSSVIALRRVPVPRDARTLGAIALIGLGNVVAPYLLITWGEEVIASGLAAVLQASAALFTLVVAHFAFSDERINPAKIIGLAMGFTGVVVLFSGELSASSTEGASLLESIARPGAIVLASLFYATFTVYSRKIIQGKVEPVVIAGGTMVTAALVMLPFSLFSAQGFTPLDSVSDTALVGVLVLGLLNTFIAYMFFYFIVRELGAARAAMVTYVVPPVGVVLGAVFLGEHIGVTLLAGAGLIFMGIAIVNLPIRRWVAARLDRVRTSPAVQGGD